MVPLPPPLAGLRERLRSLAAAVSETRQRVIDSHEALSEQLADLSAAVDSRVIDSQAALSQQLGELRAAVESMAPAGSDRMREMLLAIADREPLQRHRLWQVRAEPDYQLAFTEPEPLVTVVIPTYDNYRLLGERSIPSVLAQTYQNFEVVVVGDAAPHEAQSVVEGIGDHRVRFHNRTYRGPYPDDPRARWLVAGVPPFNEAVRMATGRWIAPLDDDDAFHPEHLEVLVGLAQRDRLELAYAKAETHWPDGHREEVGRFPPAHGHMALQMAIYHAGLASLFELELTDAAFDIPSDWGLFRRMLRAGVRAGMDDRVLVDGYPSALWMQREGASAAPRRTPDPTTSEPLPEWQYVPEGWKRADDPEELCAQGWDVEAVAEAYAANWSAFLSAIEGPGPLGVGYEKPSGAPIETTSLIDQNMILCFTAALTRAAWGRERITVLDWGGALGHYHALARKLLPEVELDYHVRELPAAVRQGRRLNPDVTFHDTDACLQGNYDFVLLSGSLQYERAWQERLKGLAQATRGKLFLSRLPVASADASFVVIQRAQAYGYATEYLGWVFSRDELSETAEGAGLELEREFLLHDPFEIRDSPEVVHHRGFLYNRSGVAG